SASAPQLRPAPRGPLGQAGLRREDGRRVGGLEPMSAETLADERAARTSSAPVLGMILFVASESMFFAAFFAIYALNFASHTTWPPKGIHNPSIGLPTVMTAAMLLSSVSVQVGLR